MKRPLLIIIALTMFHCAGTFNEAGDEDHAIRYRASYNFALEKVDRSDSTSKLYGSAKLDTVLVDTNYHSSFEDGAIKVLWGLNSRFILFSMLNKTGSTIRILWNDAAYVDQRRASHPLGHSLHLLVESSPSLVLSNTFVEDGVYPSDFRVYPISEAFGGPLRQTLFLDYELHGPINHGKYHSIDEFKSAVSTSLWSTVQILLPLEIDGRLHNYIFTFRVTDVIVDRTVHDIPKWRY